MKGDLFRGKLKFLATNKACMEHWADRTAKHAGCLGTRKFFITETNMGLDRIYEPIWALGCSFPNFDVNTVVRSLPYIACRELNVLYEEHKYGCPIGLYSSIGAWSQIEKGSYLDKMFLV